MQEFDFGPISRTVDASTGIGDAINLASLPVHEALTALLTAKNRDEFVAWLWHDLFKPLFHWNWNEKNKKFKWIHRPPKEVEEKWSKYTNIPFGLVGTHHNKKPSERRLTFSERETVNNEFDQVMIGLKARFIQLSFLTEPATNTALLRAVIADAFMEVVTKAVVASIETELANKSPTFKRVRYVFDFNQVALSTPSADAEIASLATHYLLDVNNDELIIKHLVPTAKTDVIGHHIEVVIDLTAEPPTGERFGQGIISLVELLTVYQDSRTILIGIPQFLKVDVRQLNQQVKEVAEQRLQILDVLTVAPESKVKDQAKPINRVDWSALPLIRQGQDVDLLGHVFAEQVEIRLIDPNTLPSCNYQTSQGKTVQARPLIDVASRPIKLLQGKSRRCRFCNTMFDSALPTTEARICDVFSGDFTDIEHVGFRGDICPMCRIYALNSHKSRTEAEKARGITEDRKSYRGAFALLFPSSHFTSPEQSKPIERPPLDIDGRFAKPFQRVTVTLQEFMLFNSLSRRIIGEIWKRLNDGDGTQPMPLPYLGAILLTQNEPQRVRTLFEHLEMLFDEVMLRAYPFKVMVQPAIEIAFEMVVNDLQKHHTKHTYMKTSPIIVPVCPRSKFTLLVDNELQLEVSREFFEERKRLQELLEGIKGLEHRWWNWFLVVLQGEDPVTSVKEAFYDYDESKSFGQAEKFWDTHISATSLAEQWLRYEEVYDEIKRIVSKYPMLDKFLRRR
ncbi:MAG: hypothetical protein ACUVV0_13830 [Anaerolineae bacterium]